MRNISYFSDKGVRAVIKDNIQRNWPVSLIFFLLLFGLVTIPQILIQSESPISVTLFTNTAQPVEIVLEFLLPVTMANIIFRYLFTAGSTTMMHTFPLNRKTLFAGSFISGLILTFSPFALYILTKLPLAEKRFAGIIFSDGAIKALTFESWGNLSDWLLWACMILIVLFFVYSLSVLSAILAGKSSSHIAITFLLNFIALILALIIAEYMSTFLIGFNMSMLSPIISILSMNPQVYFTTVSIYFSYDEYSGFSLMTMILYVVISCAAVFAARILYNRRKLECVGSPISFESFKTAIVCVLTLIGMSGFALFYLSEVSRYTVLAFSNARIYIGLTIGAVIAFIAITMLIQKTTRIFTLKTLRSFGIFAVIGVLFTLFTVTDISGYTDRIPAPERVKSVSMTLAPYPFDYPYPYLETTFSYFWIEGNVSFEVSSQEDIETIESIQRSLLDEEKSYRKNNYELFQGSNYFDTLVSFNYNLTGASDMTRDYTINRMLMGREALGALAEMPAFREAATIDRLAGYDTIRSIGASSGFLYRLYSEGGVIGPSDSIWWNSRNYGGTMFDPIGLSSEDMKELALCLDRDFLALDAGELVRTTPHVIYGSSDGSTEPGEVTRFLIELGKPMPTAAATEEGIDISEGFMINYLEYSITPSYTETLAWFDRYIEREKKLHEQQRAELESE